MEKQLVTVDWSAMFVYDSFDFLRQEVWIENAPFFQSVCKTESGWSYENGLGFKAYNFSKNNFWNTEIEP